MPAALIFLGSAGHRQTAYPKARTKKLDSETEPAPSTGLASKDASLSLSRQERERLRDCEPEALERFYFVFFDRVYGYVRRLLREEHLAEDVTQDIFMHIQKSLPTYDPSRELRPWVFTIATNKVRDFWRSRRHKEALREVSVDGEKRADVAVSSRRGPVEELESGEVSAAVAQAIEAMPEIMRSTLVMRYYEGLSFEEIGKMVDRNETAIRKRYSRALDELRQRLGQFLGPEGI
ncbi:MAG: RNA polymerase sigma factor [Planctomycetota bacterium]|nr:MAG: RNA polymerase sigma factor [Planctomycetota bacterium]